MVSYFNIRFEWTRYFVRFQNVTLKAVNTSVWTWEAVQVAVRVRTAIYWVQTACRVQVTSAIYYYIHGKYIVWELAWCSGQHFDCFFNGELSFTHNLVKLGN